MKELEGFHGEVEGGFVGAPKGFDQENGKVGVRWSTEGVTTRRTERTGNRIDRWIVGASHGSNLGGREVKNAVTLFEDRTDTGIATIVGPAIGAIGSRGAARTERQNATALQDSQRAEVPPAERRFHEAVPIAAELVSLPERQGVGNRIVNRLRDI